MESSVTWSLGLLVTLTASVSVSGADGSSTHSSRAGQESEQTTPAVPGYTVHEWGVFPVPRNDAWAMRDLLAEWATFPDFFHGTLPERQMNWRGPVFKPVIWFHGAEPQALVVKVHFTDGRPLIWWPPAEQPSNGMGDKADPSTLVWSVGLHIPPIEPFDPDKLPAPPEVARDHWVQSLRSVQATPLFTLGSWNRVQPDLPLHAERFLYYDGVMKVPASPTVERAEDGWILHTNLAHDALDVMLIERRAGLTWGAAEWTRVEAGRHATSITRTPMDADAQHDLETDFVNRVIQAGLHLDESMALLQVWREGFFERDGLTAFYRIPQATYDAWLPLTLQPAAAQRVRVGFVVHHHLEPELDATVQRWIRLLASQDSTERDEAEAALMAIGGPAFPWLEKGVSNPEPAIHEACRRILDALDVLRFVDLDAPSP